MRTSCGEWMIPVVVYLPYALLAGLEAAARFQETGDIVRQRCRQLVTYGDDITGRRSDRFATVDERREITATTRL